MKKVVLLLFSLGLCFLGSTSVKGCSCSIVSLFNKSIREQVLEAHREAKAVFVGKVVTVESPPKAHYRVVTLKVQSGWKGPATDRLVITTGQGGGDCGYAFEVGETYLVYAYQYNKSYLGTNICQRTKPVGSASSDLEYLGKPRFKRTAEQGERITKIQDRGHKTGVRPAILRFSVTEDTRQGSGLRFCDSRSLQTLSHRGASHFSVISKGHSKINNVDGRTRWP